MAKTAKFCKLFTANSLNLINRDYDRYENLTIKQGYNETR